MAGGKIDILVEPDLKGFEGKMESGLQGGLGKAKSFAAQLGLLFGAAELAKGIAGLGVQFESQMNTMAAVSQATGAQLDAVAEKARELGNDTSLTATSASDAAAAMTELAKGGFTVEQSMDAARGTLQLAAAAQVDAATAATIQSQALQSFSLGAADAARVSDILAGAANASSAEIEGIAQGLQQAGTVANQFGLTIDDTATALAMFANAGIQGSDAGTLLKSALLALTDQGKPAQAAMEELGLSVYDMQGNFVGLPSLFEQLARAQSEMTPEAYQAATATLFGSDAMRLAGIAADQGRGGFENLREAVTRQGQAAEVAAAQTRGLPGALERVQNAAEEAGLAIYTALSDELVAGVDAATTAIEGLGPVLAAGFETALAVIGPVASGIGDVGSAMSGLIGPATGAAAAMALAKWGDFPAKLGAGTGALKGFGDQMLIQAKLAHQSGVEITRVGEAIAVLESRSPTISKMGDAYRKSGAEARAFGQMAMMTGRQVDGLGGAMLTARGAATRFGGELRGVAAGGLSLFKSGAQGIMTMLGGPWGLALTAAGLAIGAFVQRHQEAAQAELEHKQRQDELRGTLDETTGSITAQTEALVLKRAEEEGWSKTATELGISQGTLAQAMQGNADAIRAVDAAVTVSNASAIKGSEFWAKFGEDLTRAGVSADDVAQSLNGNAEASKRLGDALDEIPRKSALSSNRAGLRDLKREIDEATEGANALRDGVMGYSDKLAEVQTQLEAERQLALAEALKATRGAVDLLGDSITAIPDDKSIRVEADAVTDETRKKLEEMGLKVSEPFNGEVTVTFPDGMDIITMLDAIGVKIDALPESGYIEIKNNSPEVQAQLEQLGLTTMDFEGKVVLNSNDPEVQERMIALGLLVREGADGEVRISDNVAEVLAKLHGLDGTRTEGDHTQNDNVDETKKRIDGLNDANTAAGHTQSDNVPEAKRRIDELNNRNTTSTHTIITRRVEMWQRMGLSPEQANRAANNPDPYMPQPMRLGGRLPAYAIGDRHSGYRLPSTGPGTEIVDGFLALDMSGMPVARLDAREWVINGESSETYHQLLRGINADTPRARAAMAAYESMPGYAKGRNPRGDDDRDTGRTDTDDTDDDKEDDTESGVDRAFRELEATSGGPYVWGGTSKGGSDCSGYVGLWQIALQDLTPREQRLGTTHTLLNGGWPDLVPGTDGLFIVGVNSQHMVAQLDGVNIESGGNGMQVGAGVTSPHALGGATLYYLPDSKIVGGTGKGRTSRSSGSSSGGDGKTDAERERERLDEMAAESKPRLARSNTHIPPDPIMSAALTGANDPTGLLELTRAGAWTDRFGITHAAPEDDPLVEFLLWAYGDQEQADADLAAAFNEANDPTGVRSMIEAGVWTGRFGAHYRAGRDSELVKAVQAARQNGGYYAIRLRELQGELEDRPSSVSELLGNAAKGLVSETTSDVFTVLGHDDELGPLLQIGLLAGKRARGQTGGVDASGKIVIEDSSATEAKSGPSSTAPGVSEAEAEEIQPTGSAVYDPARGTEQWAGEILRALSITGNPSSWQGPMTEQGDIESGGDPDAMGPDSAEGRPAGVWQVKPRTYDAYRDPNLVNDVHDVLSNGVAALRYINAEYDQLPWPTAAGYQAGGPVKRSKTGGRGPKDTIPAWLADGEFVVNADAARENEAALTMINDGADAAHVFADAAVTTGTMAAGVGIDALGGAARAAAMSMGPEGAALMPMIAMGEQLGGVLVDNLGQLAQSLADDTISTAATSLAEQVDAGYSDARLSREVQVAQAAGRGGQRGVGTAVAERPPRPINVNAPGYDRRDLVAGIREAVNIERWEQGF
ncbi:phage tail tape measure protein [Corynebacterium hansenii]|uniref:Phage tail tape measure protein n=1 Tax=Corynebacterium hansenii TaxID=394964 RepID=A0ABV7ZPL9_9CORY|nr:phage tail tape measure protein [Corynebacterium hansenii]WJZ00655.1 Phage-related minor tail protein [Corynebacterium hansenii]